MKLRMMNRVFPVVWAMVLSVPAQTVVSSFAELQPYLDDNDVHVVMTPGTYRITEADCGSSGSGLFSVPPIFTFSGTNTVFDFTDVVFEFETGIFQRFGNVDVKEVAVFGQNQVLKNLTMKDIGITRPTRTALGVLLDGVDNRVEGFNLTVRGSQPYGYGDIFGKGSGYVIKHFKHSAILVRGEGNHLLNCKVFHRAYGHGIFCQGSQNAVIEGCYVEGEVRTSDDVLAEAGSGSAADGVSFVTNWGEDENGENGYVLQPGWMFSLQEDGIRAYNTGPGLEGTNTVNTTDMQVIDCTVFNMRSGVTIGFCNDTKYVENCVTLGTENGYWVGTYGEIADCAGDAAYGPLLVNAYQNDRDSVVDLTVLAHQERYGNEILAYVGGTRHNMTFRGRDASVDPNLNIMLSGIRTGIRQYVVNTTYNDFSTTDAVLTNLTKHPVVLAAKCTGAAGQSAGSVSDVGTNNNIAQVTPGPAGGYGILQRIEAEAFSTKSGVSVQTAGDGILFVTPADDGDWICFEDFFLGSGPNRFEARVMSGAAAGSIELRRNSPAGELLGSLAVSSNSPVWSVETAVLDEPRTKCDLYLVFKGTPGALPKLDRFRLYVDFDGRMESRGLVGHWSFDDMAGTLALDASGYGHHGTVTNGAWVSGKRGGALAFDGSSSSVAIPAAAFETVNEEVTVAFWANGGASLPSENAVFYAEDSGNDRALNIHLPWTGGTVYWDAGNESGYDRISQTADVSAYRGTWSHWVFSKNIKTGNMRIYLNGALWHEGIDKNLTMTDITAASIGSQFAGRYWDGLLDDVRLYDVELMTHEVAALYASYTSTASGVPHSWLDAHGLVSGSDYEAAAQADADGDRSSNGDEFRAATNPTNAASVLRITDAAAANDGFVLEWSAETGKVYRVWNKTALNGAAWTLLEKDVPAVPPANSSTVMTDRATGFYVVEVE